MKHFLLLITLFAFFHGKAQFIATDSLDLGEDSVTHNYTRFGNVTVGNYSCGTDKSIRVGLGTSGDSITFNLAVTPNTDSIKIEVVMPWHGGTLNPKMWIENHFNDTIPYLGINSCTATVIKKGGLLSYTGDGSIKVKIMDTLSGFNMDGQFYQD